ncbi:restriction endonuclease subunit S [Kiritimatiellaeota bacterium B1221]|nr:restriction endonuclease subunit S [Kiritimatiellaeota bacterium B1221]
MSEWKEYTLTDLYSVRSGLSKPAKDFGEGYPFLSFKDVFYNTFLPSELTQLVKSTDKEREGCSVKRGDVFLTRTSETMEELGMSSVARKDYPEATFNGFCKRLRPNPDSPAYPEFVGYSLRSPQFRNELLAFSTMSTRASLNNDMISRLKIQMPPLPEQKAIAHILGSLDDKIELNRKMNETLEGMAQALFKSWFSDFDPVIDNILLKNTGRNHPSPPPLPEGEESTTSKSLSPWERLGEGLESLFEGIPDEFRERAEIRLEVLTKKASLSAEASAKAGSSIPNPSQAENDPLGNLPNIGNLFPSAFRESEELGWIPEGWETETMGSILEVTDYVANGSFATLKANVTLYDDPNYALYVRTTDYKNCFSLSKAKYVNQSSFEFLKKTRLHGDEIIISNVGDTGTVFRPPVWKNMPMTLGSNAIALKSGKDSHYFYEYFRSDFGQHQISGIVGGSAQPKFNKTDFRSLLHYLPPVEIRKIYSENVTYIWQKHTAILKNTESLAQLRDTLLPKLISGEVRITEIQSV